VGKVKKPCLGTSLAKYWSNLWTGLTTWLPPEAKKGSGGLKKYFFKKCSGHSFSYSIPQHIQKDLGQLRKLGGAQISNI